MYIRDIHVIQPYYVGTKDRKSLAMIIPAQIVKEQNLNTSSILAVKVAGKAEITLNVINTKYKEKEGEESITAGESFQASSQQV
jgi:antitoxin component of MazEF toxin-antitoxin module